MKSNEYRQEIQMSGSWETADGSKDDEGTTPTPDQGEEGKETNTGNRGGNVHVNENSLATILSFKDVNNTLGVRVTMDTSIEKAMNVIMRDVTLFKFKECGSGLYYYVMVSTDEQNNAKTNTTITPYSLLSTVTENKEFYTRADIEGTDRVRRYQEILGWPETSALKNYVNNNLLLNCNINVDDIDRSEEIYG